MERADAEQAETKGSSDKEAILRQDTGDEEWIPQDDGLSQAAPVSNRLASASDTVSTNVLSSDAQGASPAPPPVAPVLLGQSQERALGTALAGTWTAKFGKREVTLSFTEDDQLSLDESEGAYGVEGNTLTLPSGDNVMAYQCDLAVSAPGVSPSSTVLPLSGGDLTQPLKFSPQRTILSPHAYLFLEVYFGHAGKHAVRIADPDGLPSHLHDLVIFGGLLACIVVMVWVARMARKALADSRAVLPLSRPVTAANAKTWSGRTYFICVIK